MERWTQRRWGGGTRVGEEVGTEADQENVKELSPEMIGAGHKHGERWVDPDNVRYGWIVVTHYVSRWAYISMIRH